MLNGKKIGVSIPAYNEEQLIGKTLDTMPEYMDSIVVVNDGSSDRTEEIVREYQKRDPRIVLVNHDGNKGLGQALITGYLAVREQDVDMVTVMAGDAQMSPDDLPALCQPIIDGWADYTKGNRLFNPEVTKRMPLYRFVGNSGLTILTKFATGYWFSVDPQCGYTVISTKALKKIPIENMTRGYAYNADILNMLNLENFRVADVEIEPIYGDEKSKIKLHKYIPLVIKLLAKLTIKRVTIKYLVKDFHPLALLYIFGLINLVVFAIPLAIRFLYLYFQQGIAPLTTLVVFTLAFNSGITLLLFGMWMDMEDNKKLRGEEIRV